MRYAEEVTWFVPIAVLLAGEAVAGLFGSDAPGRIPVPARLFEAKVEDVAGVALTIDRVSFDGEVFLYGTIGRAKVTVPFEDIVEVAFVAADGGDEEHRTAVVRTRDRDEVRVLVDADLAIYGQASFGNYRLDVADARSLTIVSGPRPLR